MIERRGKYIKWEYTCREIIKKRRTLEVGIYVWGRDAREKRRTCELVIYMWGEYVCKKRTTCEVVMCM